MPTPDQIIDVVAELDTLADLPRTGWLLRGVSAPESLADHSYGVALVAMLMVDALREAGDTVDGERVLRLALLHDAAEARTGDVPMPNKTEAVSAALHALEAGIVADLLPASHLVLWREAEAGETLEARVVKAADKIQMMIKVWIYERTRGARLDEFWANPSNFRTMGLPVADALFNAICARAKRHRPDR